MGSFMKSILSIRERITEDKARNPPCQGWIFLHKNVTEIDGLEILLMCCFIHYNNKSIKKIPAING